MTNIKTDIINRLCVFNRPMCWVFGHRMQYEGTHYKGFMFTPIQKYNYECLMCAKIAWRKPPQEEPIRTIWRMQNEPDY